MAMKGDRAVVKRAQDNLKLEGSFEGRKSQQTIVKGERAEVRRHTDNLKVEGTFEGRIKAEALVGERAKAVKHSDNLKIEGEMTMKKAADTVMVGDRAAVVKHHDNLKMEGSFAGVQSEAHSSLVQAKGERAEVKKRQDNLKMEGSMQGLVSEARSASQVRFGCKKEQKISTQKPLKSNFFLEAFSTFHFCKVWCIGHQTFLITSIQFLSF